MFLSASYKPEFNSLRDSLLELAQVRHVDDLLRRVVTILADRPHVALARIWLKADGDQCDACHSPLPCHDHSACLHLVATTTSPRATGRTSALHLNGECSRVPLHAGDVGLVGATGEPIVIKDFDDDPSLISRYPWAAEHHLHGLNVQPIKFKDQLLGVLAIVTFIPTPDEGPVWLRIFADEIAGAIVNARAFEEIEQLKSRLEAENDFLQQEVREANAFGSIIGAHPSIRRLLKKIEMVAPTDASVLILGESGTGKELVAREVHRLSRRNERPLIRVNCASVPRELYESEFFGHIKGAFTGAIKDRAGRFEAADGGTLFLDEVGEIPLELQSKFLRVLQEKQYERVGEEKTRTVDVRIIAATNRDLRAEVDAGRFRQDLYYRLNVFPVEVPPLRDHKEDIPLLAAHFLKAAARRLRVPLPQFTEAHSRLLESYSWPGNVRELQNATERGLILAQQGQLHFDLPGLEPAVPFAVPPPATSYPPNDFLVLTELEFREREKLNTLAALKKADWRIHGRSGAAELLGVKPTTLISRIKKMGIKRPT